MTVTTRVPEVRLTYQRRGAVLVGTAGGRPVHSPVSVEAGDSAAFPLGRYRLAAATTHPPIGRVAIVEAGSGRAITVQHAPAANALARAITVLHAPAANALARAVTVQHAPAPNGLARAITVQHAAAANALAGATIGLLLPAAHRASFPGVNAIAVLSGFEELMDALELSGGGILEVVA